jgi:hypothetical protein
MQLPELLPRGVWAPPCLDSAGYRYLAVVDSRGRCVHRQRLFSCSDDEIAGQTLMLRRWLDERDPIRTPEVA